MDQKELDELLDTFERYKHHIGGRDADIEQLALCLAYFVKEQFEINQVPDHIIMALDLLRKRMVMASNSYQETIKTIQDEFKKMFEEEKKLEAMGMFAVNPCAPPQDNTINIKSPIIATTNPMTISIDWSWIIQEILNRNGCIDGGTLKVLTQLREEQYGGK